MKFSDIKQFTIFGNYSINVSWRYMGQWLKEQIDELKLDINPDFQRAHVWSEAQQIAYIEFCLRGGRGSNTILFNCCGWNQDFKGPFVLVDGKQRLEAVRKFLNDELIIFDKYKFSDFEDVLYNTGFIVVVNNLKSIKDVLIWYLELNSGGVVHTKEELQKVKDMLKN